VDLRTEPAAAGGTGKDGLVSLLHDQRFSFSFPRLLAATWGLAFLAVLPHGYYTRTNDYRIDVLAVVTLAVPTIVDAGVSVMVEPYRGMYGAVTRVVSGFVAWLVDGLLFGSYMHLVAVLSWDT